MKPYEYGRNVSPTGLEIVARTSPPLDYGKPNGTVVVSLGNDGAAFARVLLPVGMDDFDVVDALDAVEDMLLDGAEKLLDEEFEELFDEDDDITEQGDSSVREKYEKAGLGDWYDILQAARTLARRNDVI